MLWLGEIFRTVGWWNDASIKAFHDEFTAERLNAEEEDRGNQWKYKQKPSVKNAGEFST